VAPVRAIVVGVPARDEEESVAACIASIDRAATAVAPVPVVLVLAADRCTDATAVVAAQLAPVSVTLEVMCGAWGSAGAARAAAIERALAVIGGCPTETWIATTDADTTVGADWLSRQLDHVRSGAEAIAGIVELLDDRHRSERVVRAFQSIYRLEGDNAHPHVHGANLGVRADWYAAAGGFAGIEVGEDHALWTTLRRLGARCLSTIDGRVATSARLHSRAPDGFADTLRRATEAPA
jgi:glycosyltransferase involved in cell wall biosynthesis